MSKVYFISDTHFHHRSCWAIFKRPDGTPLRDFSSTEEMNQAMVDSWNSRVNKEDTVYHLGDVTLSKKVADLNILKKLNGNKILIMGNHDLCLVEEYRIFFSKIYGCKAYKDAILTHIPVHPCQLLHRFKYNIHGHMHWNTVTDKNYFNVSVERLNYVPITYDEIVERIENYQSKRERKRNRNISRGE